MPIVRVGKWSGPVCIQSTPRAANAVHYAGNCLLYEVLVETDGTNDVIVNIFDNAEAAVGTRIGNPNMTVPGEVRSWSYCPPLPREMKKGIFITILCTGTCSVIAHYDTGEEG